MITKREIVWAYRMFLGREPENEDIIKKHLRQFKTKTINDFRDFCMSSQEFIGYFSLINKVSGITGNQSKSDELYISLGSHCYTSHLLKILNKKEFSCPFDWLFSSPEMVIHCLETNFSFLTNPQFYAPVAKENRMYEKANLCQHTFYRDHYGVNFVFNHHNPTDIIDYHYLLRCVKRFQDLNNTQRIKKYIMTTRQCSDENFEHLENLLCSDKPNTRFLCIEIKDDSNDIGWHCKKTKNQSQLVEYNSFSKWGSLAFEESFDDNAIAKIITCI